MPCPGPWKNTFLFQCLTWDVYYFIYYVSGPLWDYELLKASDRHTYRHVSQPSSVLAFEALIFPTVNGLMMELSQKVWSPPFFLSRSKPDSLSTECFYIWTKLNFRGNCKFEGRNIPFLQRTSLKKCKICERK